MSGYELDAEALRNGTLSVVHARGLFADGLSFNMPEFDELPAVRAVADLFPPMQDSLDFFLAVPERHSEGIKLRSSVGS